MSNLDAAFSAMADPTRRGILARLTLGEAALLLVAMSGVVGAGYLDENPDEVFAPVYERIGAVTGAAEGGS